MSAVGMERPGCTGLPVSPCPTSVPSGSGPQVGRHTGSVPFAGLDGMSVHRVDVAVYGKKKRDWLGTFVFFNDRIVHSFLDTQVWNTWNNTLPRPTVRQACVRDQIQSVRTKDLEGGTILGKARVVQVVRVKVVSGGALLQRASGPPRQACQNCR